MKNALSTKNNEMSFNGADKLRNEIHDGLKILSKGFIAIMPQLNKLYDCKGFKALGYQNFDEMCRIEFGMSHGTTVGIRKVWKMIGSVTANNEYIIPEKYKEWGYTQLLTIANDKADFEKAGILPFEVFTPDMKVKDMTKALADALALKAKEQDENAIETDGTFTESTESAESAESTESTESAESTESTESTENTENRKDPIALIDIMLTDCKVLNELLEGMKPEKLCLLDGVVSNLKALKAETKKMNK